MYFSALYWPIWALQADTKRNINLEAEIMEARRFIGKTFPASIEALNALDTVIKESGVDKWYQELIKIRASNLNGCAYCLDTHVQDAISLGVDPRKVNLVAVWREADSHFTAEEQLVLRVAEQITLIFKVGLDDRLYSECVATFGEEMTGKIIMVATLINTWNRIGISFRMQPRF